MSLPQWVISGLIPFALMVVAMAIVMFVWLVHTAATMATHRFVRLVHTTTGSIAPTVPLAARMDIVTSVPWEPNAARAVILKLASPIQVVEMYGPLESLVLMVVTVLVTVTLVFQTRSDVLDVLLRSARCFQQDIIGPISEIVLTVMAVI